MRRSISSRVAASVSVLLLCLSSGFLQAEEFIDDKSLKQSFEEKIGQFYEAGEIPAPSAIRRQLRKLNRFSIPVSESSREAHLPASSIYTKTREATLVFGHLYLCGKCDKLHGSLATAILVSADGLALTNYHVVDFERAKAFGAMTAEGAAFPVESVVASNQKTDLALVRLGGAESLPFVRLAREAKVGDPVFVVSHPDSHFYTLSTGFISRFYVTPKAKAPRLQITAPFARGSSGAGVINQSGHLVGLVTATNSIYYNQEEKRQEDLQMVINSCVPLDSIRDLIATSPPISSPTQPPESDRAANEDDGPPQP